MIYLFGSERVKGKRCFYRLGKVGRKRSHSFFLQEMSPFHTKFFPDLRSIEAQLYSNDESFMIFLETSSRADLK